MTGTTFRAHIDRTGENIMTPAYHRSYLQARTVGFVDVNIDRPSRTFEFDCPYPLAGDYMALHVTNGGTGADEDGFDMFYHLTTVDLPFAVATPPSATSYGCFIRLRADLDLYHTVLMGDITTSGGCLKLLHTSFMVQGHHSDTPSSVTPPRCVLEATDYRAPAIPSLGNNNPPYALLMRVLTDTAFTHPEYLWIYVACTNYSDAVDKIMKVIKSDSVRINGRLLNRDCRICDLYMLPAVYISNWLQVDEEHSVLFQPGETYTQGYYLETSNMTVNSFGQSVKPGINTILGNTANRILFPASSRKQHIYYRVAVDPLSNEFSFIISIGSAQHDISSDCKVALQYADEGELDRRDMQRMMSLLGTTVAGAVAIPNAMTGNVGGAVVAANQIVQGGANLAISGIDRTVPTIYTAGGALAAQKVELNRDRFTEPDTSSYGYGVVFLWNSYDTSESAFDRNTRGDVANSPMTRLSPWSDEIYCYVRGEAHLTSGTGTDISPMLKRFADLHRADVEQRIADGVRVWSADYLESWNRMVTE